MSNYYCTMAGAPALSLTDTKPGLTTAELRAQLEPELTSGDRRLLNLLFLRRDGENLVRLLRDPEAEVLSDGLYSREELLALIEEAGEIDLGTSRFPEFLLQFVRDYRENAGREGWYAEDEVLLQYYEYAIRQSHDAFARRWFQLNLDVANLLTALIARRQGWKVADFVKGEGETVETIRTSEARDFGLGAQVDYVAAVMPIAEEEDPVEKERRLDAFKWMWLDEQTFADTFSVEAVFAYLCKLDILERWARLDPTEGRETFERIINDLRSEAQVPSEFIRK